MKMKPVTRLFMQFSMAAVFLLLGASFALAANSPESATMNMTGVRIQSTTGMSVPAQAGNVSELIINDTRATNHWQGYYGRITGTITLDDAKNNTLFDWQLASPLGEIFFSNASAVEWANITCVNMSGSASTGSRSTLNATILEGAFNISATEMDGINETFNWTFGSSFAVGSTTIDGSYNCPLAYTYVSQAAQQARFKEVILTDNLSAVFTTLIEQDQAGYDGSPYDFQALVPENQAPGPSDYFVYVELT